jgi:succinate dehydrogenase / fumarate reductase flavoprotein subunit
LVFGQRAGQHAARYARSLASQPQVNQDEIEKLASLALAPFNRTSGENPYALHEELRALMQSHVGIVRSEDDLKSALEQLQGFRRRAANVWIGGNIQYNPGWHLALDLWNMLDISEAVTRAALERTESRGAHTREEYPDSDPAWGKVNLVVRQQGDQIAVVREPLPQMPDELRAILEEK